MTKFRDSHGVEAFWAPRNHIAEGWKDLVFFHSNWLVWGQCVLSTQLYTHKFLYLSDPALIRISMGPEWNVEVSPTPSGKLLKQLPISTKVRPSPVLNT